MSAFYPAALLRAEGVMLFVAATALYWREDGSWLVFAVAFFLPDVSMVGYFAGARIGAAIYNAAHALVVPILLALIGLTTDTSILTAVSLIWLAHIGFDHAIGYGLKYADGFKETHLARV